MPFKQSGRATIVGSCSRGSTGQPYLYRFDNGMSFRVSTKRVYLPDTHRSRASASSPTSRSSRRSRTSRKIGTSSLKRLWRVRRIDDAA